MRVKFTSQTLPSPWQTYLEGRHRRSVNTYRLISSNMNVTESSLTALPERSLCNSCYCLFSDLFLAVCGDVLIHFQQINKPKLNYVDCKRLSFTVQKLRELCSSRCSDGVSVYFRCSSASYGCGANVAHDKEYRKTRFFYGQFFNI